MRRTSLVAPPAGTFKPRPPRDSAGVITLCAVAARVVCIAPHRFADVSSSLADALRPLAPPECYTAAECARLWQAFGRALVSLRRERWELAGKAFVRDLERVASTMDVMPLVPWERLPQALDDTKSAVSVVPRGRCNPDPGLDPESSSHKERHPQSGVFEAIEHGTRRVSPAGRDDADEEHEVSPEMLERARHVGARLRALDSAEELLHRAASAQAISKGEAVMLATWLVKSLAPQRSDGALVDALIRVGEHLRRG